MSNYELNAELNELQAYNLNVDLPAQTQYAANLIVNFNPVRTSQLTNDGDGSSPFATQSYVDSHGGKIDVIKKNGVVLEIVNKTVDIPVSTKTSDLTNDSGFITSSYHDNTKQDVISDLSDIRTGASLGVNNLATCVNNVGNKPFIINGKPLKSINQYSNKLKAKYMSYIGDKGTSRNVKKVVFKRNNLISNYLHHASRFIINYCTENEIGTIVIGHNEGWKQEVKMGNTKQVQHKNHQNFVQIPFNTLIQQIQYKAEEVGIGVIVTEESYSSKVDHLAFEEMKHHENYLGRRVKRGLFKSSTGKYLNADVNGTIGIARKVTGDEFVKNLTSRGQAFCPIKFNLY